MDSSSRPLQGRACVVTGAAGGIGQAIARVFVQAGGRVACLDLAPLAAADGTTAHICDVGDPASCERAVAEAVAAHGPIRVLVNAAAPLEPTGDVLALAPPDWNRTLAVGLTGAYLMSRAALPSMIGAGGGSIIHVASQLGRVGAEGRPAYCAVKGALIQLAKAMAVDHAAQGVRVNALSPGAVETARLVFRHGSMEEARRLAAPKHVLGRLGRPEEIAAAALFLASDASSFMTGADLLVDGGYTAV